MGDNLHWCLVSVLLAIMIVFVTAATVKVLKFPSQETSLKVKLEVPDPEQETSRKVKQKVPEQETSRKVKLEVPEKVPEKVPEQETSLKVKQEVREPGDFDVVYLRANCGPRSGMVAHRKKTCAERGG